MGLRLYRLVQDSGSCKEVVVPEDGVGVQASTCMMVAVRRGHDLEGEDP